MVIYTSHIHAQDKAQAKASVTIVSNIEVQKKENLKFGEIISPKDKKTTFRLKPDGTFVGNGSLINGDSHHAAVFKIRGKDKACYNFSVVENTVEMKGAKSGKTMKLHHFTFDKSSKLTAEDGEDANDIVRFGATLEIDAGQKPDSYSATFNVVANYD